MKNLLFLAMVLTIASCNRHNLNYQSSHSDSNQDNTPAPQTATNPNNYSDAPAQSAPQQQYNSAPAQTNNQQPQQDYYTTNSQVNYSNPSYQTFYDDLSPYGNWVNYPVYGYVWVPNAGPDFSPYYTNGQWVYSNYGWTWASGYSWGWAPFHYGRWMRDDMYGWIWVPGNEWAPAWVTWGQTGGYYGWAPIGPGVVVYEGYRPPARNWNYVSAQYIAQPNVSSHAINSYSGNRGEAIDYNQVNIINNHVTYNQNTYNGGPRANEIEAVTGTKITPVTVTHVNKPLPGSGVTGNQMNIYRPIINNANTSKAAPAKIIPITTLKQVNNTPVLNQNRTIQNNPNNQGQPVNIQRPNQVPVQQNNQRPNQVPVEQNNQRPNEVPTQRPVPNNQNQNERPLPPVNQAPVQQNNQRPNEVPTQRPVPVFQNQNERPAPPVNQAPVQQNNQRPNEAPVQRPVQPVQNVRPVEPVRQQPAPNNNPRPVQSPPNQQNKPFNRPKPQPQPRQVKSEPKKN